MLLPTTPRLLLSQLRTEPEAVPREVPDYSLRKTLCLWANTGSFFGLACKETRAMGVQLHIVWWLCFEPHMAEIKIETVDIW